jgi:hypothetical protein
MCKSAFIEQLCFIGLKYRNGPLSGICVIIVSESSGEKETSALINYFYEV